MKHTGKVIEIFRAGTHRAMGGQTVTLTPADLAASARAYDPAKHEAPVVVGHPRDNAPAFGWVQRLFARGSKLRSAVDQLEPAFAEGVRSGRYKKVSACFYAPDSPDNPVPGVYYLRHVGFLGAMPPAVKGLEAVSFSDGGDRDCVTVEFSEGGFLSFAEEVAAAVAAEVGDAAGEAAAGAATEAATDAVAEVVAEEVEGALGEKLKAALVEKLKAALPDVDEAVLTGAIAAAIESALAPPEGDAESPVEAAVEKAVEEKLAPAVEAAVEKAVEEKLAPAVEAAVGDAVPAADSAGPAGSASFAEGRRRPTAAERALRRREAQLVARERALRSAEHVAFVEKVLGEGRRTGAGKTELVGLLEFAATADASLSFGEGERKRTPLELIKTLIAKAPKEVHLEELTGGLELSFSEESDPRAVAEAAKAYQAEQEKLGRRVTTAQAVDYVKGIGR